MDRQRAAEDRFRRVADKCGNERSHAHAWDGRTAAVAAGVAGFGGGELPGEETLEGELTGDGEVPGARVLCVGV